MVKNQGQVFKVTRKLETLTPDVNWMILDYMEQKKGKGYYKLMLADQKNYRAIAIIKEEDYDKYVQSGEIVLLEVRKIKYARESAKNLSKI